MKVAVTGSSGLIGTALVASLRADGHEVVRLVRRPPRGGDEVRWDPRARRRGLIPGALDGVDACVHLAGAGVADHRWTAAYKAEIRASRVLGTRALAGRAGRSAARRRESSSRPRRSAGTATPAAGRSTNPPRPGTAFLARRRPGLGGRRRPGRGRRASASCTPRSGLVLGPARRGARPAAAAGPAGPVPQVRRRAPGDELDLADRRDPRHPLPARPARDISGPFNLTAPNPVTNAEFTAALTTPSPAPTSPGCRCPPRCCAWRSAKPPSSC